MRNYKYYSIILLSMILLLTGCDNKQNSQASILIVNSNEYIGQELVSKSSYLDVEYLGVVTKKLDQKTNSTEDIYANELDIGTKIYRVDLETLLGDFNEENYKLFKIKK